MSPPSCLLISKFLFFIQFAGVELSVFSLRLFNTKQASGEKSPPEDTDSVSGTGNKDGKVVLNR